MKLYASSKQPSAATVALSNSPHPSYIDVTITGHAIQTFKGHFIAKFAGVDNSFSINKWDSLFPQAVLTLNLL